MKAPEILETRRLRLRKPSYRDAEAIFSQYASDPEVTRFVGWSRHTSVAETRAFLKFSELEWFHWPSGPYLIEQKHNTQLIGSTGLSFETSICASTGYVLARDMWGFGYATEALRAMVKLSEKLGVQRLFALCHPDHRASRHVLEKCGFICEGLSHKKLEFPNHRLDKKEAISFAIETKGLPEKGKQPRLNHIEQSANIHEGDSWL